MTGQKRTWIIVTGLSGSGKSVALDTLEDLGFHCVDNLPIGLVDAMRAQIDAGAPSGLDRVALGLDIRSGGLDLMPAALDQLTATIDDLRVYFFTADDPTLIRRYSETRRKHPLETGHRRLAQAIAAERTLMQPLQDQADSVFDTTALSIHQLRRAICEALGMGDQPLVLLIESFAFKQGVPPDVDFAFDARCLPNPHWVPELKPLTGREPEVQAYLERHDVVNEYIADLCRWIEKWLPAFEAQDRSSLTVGIGCTGGKHRSVYIAERVADHFRGRREHVLTYHRELVI